MSTIENVVCALERLQSDGEVEQWELPHKSYLRQLDAAVFFVEPARERDASAIWSALRRLGSVSYRENHRKVASPLKWEVRITARIAADIGVAEIDRFRREGFLVIDNLLSQSDVRQIIAAMDRVYGGVYNDDRRPSGWHGKPVVPFGSVATVRWMLNSRLLDADLWRLATDRRLGEIAAKLLNTSSVSIIEDQLLDKPSQGCPVNMHQDHAYWPFCSSTATITCWISLMHDIAGHGGLTIARGSHMWGLAQRPNELMEGREQEWLSAIEMVRPREAAIDLVSIEVPLGGGVFFHGLTFHGSAKNMRREIRRACSLHWACAESRVHLANVRHVDHPYLFAGIANGGPLVNAHMPMVYPAYAVGPSGS